MFSIVSLSLPQGRTAQLIQTAPKLTMAPVTGTTLGPDGAVYHLDISDLGTLTLTDMGDTIKGPGALAVQVNDAYWFYNGTGEMQITVDAQGNCTIAGGAGTVTASLTPPAPPYVPQPGSITAENTLMQQHKAAAVLPPQSSFVSLQSNSGNGLIFAISQTGAFQLLQQQNGQPTGWASAGIGPTQATGQAKKFAAIQHLSNGDIDLALVISGPQGDQLFALTGLPNTDSADWMQTVSNSRNWIEIPYDDDQNPISTLEIEAVYLAPVSAIEGNTAVLLCEVNMGGTTNYLQNYTVNFGGPGAWAPMTTSTDFTTLLSQCMGQLQAVQSAGMYQLTTLGSGAGLNFVPFFGMFGNNSVTPVNMTAPAGATKLAALTADSSGDTNLFVAATAGIYLFTPDNQSNNVAQLVCATDLAIGLSDFFAYETANTVMLWGLNQQGQVFYTQCPKGQESDPAQWTQPVPIYSNVARISAFVNQATGGINTFAHTTEQELVHLAQDPTTTLWQSTTMVLPPPDYTAMVDFHAYSTHVEVKDTQGFPMANVEVQISVLNNCAVFINDVYHFLPANTPITIATDVNGHLSIVQETADIAAVCYALSCTGIAALAVNPMSKVMTDHFATINSTQDLMQATVTDGTGTVQPLVNPSLPSDQQQATVTSLQHFVAVGNKMPANGGIYKAPPNPSLEATPNAGWGVVHSQGAWTVHQGADAQTYLSSRLQATQSGDGIKVAIGDIWRWLKHAYQDVTSHFVHFVDGAYHFFVELGGKIYRGIVNCLADVLHGIEFVFKMIAVGFEDLVKWVGFLFNWGDIVRTHKVIKNICLQYIGSLVTQVNGWKTDISDNFSTLINSIDQWAGITDNIPPELQNQTNSGLHTSNGSINGSNTPQYNYGAHQLKSNVGAGTTSAVVQYQDASANLYTVFETALETQKDILGAAYYSFKTQVLDKWHELTIGQIFKAIGAILADALLESAENLIFAIIDLAQALSSNILQIFSAPIQIPVLSPLYKLISGGEELSFFDLACLVMAIPATIGAKLIPPFHTLFPSDDPTTNALINAKSFEEIQQICKNPPAGAALGSLSTTINNRLALAGGILSAVGAVFMAFVGYAKKAYPESKILAALNGFFYLPYVFPDIAGQIPDMQNKKWWAISNAALGGVTTIMVLVDTCLAMGAKDPVAGELGASNFDWSKVSPRATSVINFAWLFPTIWPIGTKEYQNKAGILGIVGGTMFDISGILTWPIECANDSPNAEKVLFVVNTVANLGYGGCNLASGIITYKGG